MKSRSTAGPMDEVHQSSSEIVLTNYERVRDGDIQPEFFTATSLDEAQRVEIIRK